MFLLDDIKKEIQENDRLCWAAVSAMAMSTFPEQGRFKHLSQKEIVIFKRANIATLSALAKARGSASGRDRLQRLEDACKPPGTCNIASDDLLLFDIKSAKAGKNRALSPDHFAVEIGERKRPVAIHWNYLGKKPTNGELRSGGHVLIVTGYNEQTHELRIWDPWPAPTNPDPITTAHEKWIPFELYLDPQSDQGMDAVAVHEQDSYKMRRVGEKAPSASRYPALMDLSRGGPVRPNHVKFDSGLCDLSREIGSFLDYHVVRGSRGEVIHGPYQAGTPFPIVTVGAAELLEAGQEPDSLLKPETSAVVVPVLKDGQIIDSFQLLHEKDKGWRAAGYSNNRIAALLSRTHNKRAATRPAQGFYLVSMPELSNFYVMHGFWDRAELVSEHSPAGGEIPRARRVLCDLVHRRIEAGKLAKSGKHIANRD
jgi:hypothetical protein